MPDEKRGRVESALNTLIMVATTVSMGLAGLLGDVLGLRLFFLLAGFVTIISGGMAYFTLQIDVPLPSLIPDFLRRRKVESEPSPDSSPPVVE